MSRTTKLELAQLLSVRTTEVEALRTACAEREGTIVALRSQLSRLEAQLAAKAEIAVLDAPVAAAKPTPTPAGMRRVYEFDPAVAGDFVRAQALARANRGTVRRIGR